LLLIQGFELPLLHTEAVHMGLIMATPNKHSKTGVYYFRKRVPTDLVDAFRGNEVKFSLRTKLFTGESTAYEAD
jgi:hypothetical protein